MDTTRSIAPRATSTGLPQVGLVADPLLSGGLLLLATRQLGLLTTAQVRAHEVTSSAVRHRLATGRWRRPTRGVLDAGARLPRDLPPSHRVARSAVLGILAFGPTSIAVGLSALALQGVWGVPPGSAPQVALPGASARLDRDDIRCRRFHPSDEIIRVSGFASVSALDALAQSLPEVDPRTALGLVDSALHRGVITLDDLATLKARLRGRRGARRLTDIWPLVDSRRESPLESWACFDLHTAGLVPTDIQVTFTDEAGRVLARADIGFELEDGSWHLVELDGRDYHLRPAADDLRDNALVLAVARSHRATVVRYRSEHLGSRGRLVRETREALAGRTWTRPANAGLVPLDLARNDSKPAFDVVRGITPRTPRV